MSDPQCDLHPNTLCKTFLTCGQSIGLMITAEAGLLSIAAVLALFGMMIRNFRRHYKANPQSGWQLIKSPLEVYMLSLFVADLIQGLGMAFTVRWVARGTVTCGAYCTTQGVMQQLGQTIVAMSTLAIAVHTFIIILFRRGAESVLFATFMVCLMWVYVILFVSISVSLHTRGGIHLETPTPYWCWIGTNFTPERIAGEYFWFWFTGLTSVVLYVILYFCLRGNIRTEEKRWWRIHFRRRRRSVLPISGARDAQQTAQELDRPQDSNGAGKEAFMMLLYPVCYVVLVLPLSIVRWIQFVLQAHQPVTDPNNVHQTVSAVPVIIAQTIFALSGVVNVTLLFLTRPGILLFREPPARSSETAVFGVFNTTREDHEAGQGHLRSRPLASIAEVT